ncbi:MAG: ABC transporter ATP-binding protein [Alphaproteobacteria bacterium]|nr:ABC transporter ATP-binding protein [Alphaproteobacteria bacterium]
MLDIQGLTKRFGPRVAVDDVRFSVSRGEVLGFLGPNGAGKTTTMRMITGFLTPTEGRAIVCGHDVEHEPIAVKARLGYLPEGAPLYEDMTPAGFLGFVAEVRGKSGADRRNAIEAAAATLGLGGVMYQPIGTLSKGFKRRVGLAQAILHDPEVLILDEPTDGLDPNQKHEVRALIHRMAANKAIVISTHLLEEVDAVCTRAIIIARGRIVADAAPGELQARSTFHNAVTLRIKEADAERARAELKAIAAVAAIETVDQVNGVAELRVTPASGKAILADVSAMVRAGGFVVEEIRQERGHLDQVFRDITTRS